MAKKIATLAQAVIDSFESTFRDKEVIPEELELVWLAKAVARYSVEIEPITYDAKKKMFVPPIEQYTIDLLGAYMKQYYQEREVSKVNKRASIVSKDISLDGGGHSKTAERAHLEYVDGIVKQMEQNLKTPAYN